MKPATSCRRQEAADVFKKRRANMINSNFLSKEENFIRRFYLNYVIKQMLKLAMSSWNKFFLFSIMIVFNLFSKGFGRVAGSVIHLAWS